VLGSTDDVRRAYDEPRVGAGDVCWVSASVIDVLRKRAKEE